MSESDYKHLEALLSQYRRRLNALELQAAQFGIYAPPHVTIEIDDLNKKVQEIRTQLDSSSSPPSPTAASQDMQLSSAQFNQLVTLLLAVPVVADGAARESILQSLDRRITNSVVRSSQNKVDVANILRAALNYSGGLDALLDQVRFFDDGTRQMQAVESFVSSSRGAS